jgi:hypothetical protein
LPLFYTRTLERFLCKHFSTLVAYFARLVHTLTTSDFSFSYFSETKMLSIGWHIWMLVFWVLKGGSLTCLQLEKFKLQ